VHVKQVSISLPLCRVVDRGQRIERIGERGKVRLQGELEVLDVLHRVFGIVVEGLVVEPVVLLGIEDAPSRSGKERDHDKDKSKYRSLHIPVIGRAESIFQISSWMASAGLSPLTMEMAMPLALNFSRAAR